MSPSELRRLIQRGEPVVVEAVAPTGPYAAVFEDDGDTGYLYGLDTRESSQPILDALLIYNFDRGTGRRPDAELRIAWSRDGGAVALFLDGTPQAAFDFTAHRGYCRSNFPPRSSWSTDGHAWDDSVLRHIGPAA